VALTVGFSLRGLDRAADEFDGSDHVVAGFEAFEDLVDRERWPSKPGRYRHYSLVGDVGGRRNSVGGELCGRDDLERFWDRLRVESL
jgi:hypothetical protein